MTRALVLFILIAVGAAVTASAASLSVNGGTIQAFHYSVQIEPQYAVPAECADMTFDNVIVGTEDADELHGTNGRDLIFGLGGNDTIDGSGNQADCIVGGEGDDELYSDNSGDVVIGGEGNDKLYSGNAGDALYGGPGDDTLYGDNGTDLMHGGPGDDKLFGGNGPDDLYGDEGDDDYCDGGSGPDYIDLSCEHDGAPSAADAVGHHTIPTIDVTWAPAVEARYYNVYRSQTPGGPYVGIGSTAKTTFSDVGVAEDTWYYYVVTAVIIEGLESEPSNEAAAMVPAASPTAVPTATTAPAVATPLIAAPTPVASNTAAPSPTATATTPPTSSPTPTATFTPTQPPPPTATSTPTPTATPSPTPGGG
jgi:hypothetical protein